MLLLPGAGGCYPRLSGCYLSSATRGTLLLMAQVLQHWTADISPLMEDLYHTPVPVDPRATSLSFSRGSDSFQQGGDVSPIVS